MNIKQEILERVNDGATITRAVMEHAQTTGCTAPIVALLQLRELAEQLPPFDTCKHVDCEDYKACPQTSFHACYEPIK